MTISDPVDGIIGSHKDTIPVTARQRVDSMNDTVLRIAVIIRFKNEAAFLPTVLKAVASQEVAGAQVRIVGIDNGSEDGSRAVAERLCDRVLEIDNYMPGAAINLAMREESCDFAAILSAHTLPASNQWLRALLTEARKPDTLAVYGAQLYPINSHFLDKRDLDIFSTRRPRIEVRDSDFWNANSMFSRTSWEAAAFDERTFELEDHYWTKCQLNGTNCIRFVPDSLVYHYTHISRNDRTFLPPRLEADADRLDRAIAKLNDSSAEWPETMMAALTVKSMKNHHDATNAIPALTRHLGQHWDFDVRWRMAGTLGKLPDPDGVDALITALSDPSFYARDEAAWALAELGAFAAPRLLGRLNTVPQREWPLAALALGRSGHPEAEEKAVELIDHGLRDTPGSLKRDYLYAAGELEGPLLSKLADHINTLVETDQNDLRAVAVWAAGSMSGLPVERIDWARIRSRATDDPDPMVRVEAVAALNKALLHRDDSAAVDLLAGAAHDSDVRVRFVAVQSARILAESGGPMVSVTETNDDADHGVRFESELLLHAITYGRAVPTKNGTRSL